MGVLPRPRHPTSMDNPVGHVHTRWRVGRDIAHGHCVPVPRGITRGLYRLQIAFPAPFDDEARIHRGVGYERTVGGLRVPPRAWEYLHLLPILGLQCTHPNCWVPWV